MPHIARNAAAMNIPSSRYLPGGSMGIVGDMGLAFGILLFAFGVVGFITRS
jgi:hypothetical protein